MRLCASPHHQATSMECFPYPFRGKKRLDREFIVDRRISFLHLSPKLFDSNWLVSLQSTKWLLPEVDRDELLPSYILLYPLATQFLPLIFSTLKEECSWNRSTFSGLQHSLSRSCHPLLGHLFQKNYRRQRESRPWWKHVYQPGMLRISCLKTLLPKSDIYYRI